MIHGRAQNLRGTLTVVAADNLASQLIGGFKGLSSAFRKCQQCLAVNDDIQTKVSILSFKIYTLHDDLNSLSFY